MGWESESGCGVVGSTIVLVCLLWGCVWLLPSLIYVSSLPGRDIALRPTCNRHANRKANRRGQESGCMIQIRPLASHPGRASFCSCPLSARTRQYPPSQLRDAWPRWRVIRPPPTCMHKKQKVSKGKKKSVVICNRFCAAAIKRPCFDSKVQPILIQHIAWCTCIVWMVVNKTKGGLC